MKDFLQETLEKKPSSNIWKAGGEYDKIKLAQILSIFKSRTALFRASAYGDILQTEKQMVYSGKMF